MGTKVSLKLELPAEGLAFALTQLSDNHLELVLRLLASQYVMNKKGESSSASRKRLTDLCSQICDWSKE